MSTAFVISMVAVVIALGVVFMSARSGPRVTTIETRRETEDQKSGSDA